MQMNVPYYAGVPALICWTKNQTLKSATLKQVQRRLPRF